MVKVLPFSFEQCFCSFTFFRVKGSSETGLPRHLINHFFRIPEVQKYIGYEGTIFFENLQNWIWIDEMQKKIQKIFFASVIHASEIVAINSLC